MLRLIGENMLKVNWHKNQAKIAQPDLFYINIFAP